ncbi:hypothetical protein GW17_00051190 [Ensete ventricosum]|nr:hypothetical protein GW17_00051190 [Ensete ventricosum]
MPQQPGSAEPRAAHGPELSRIVGRRAQPIAGRTHPVRSVDLTCVRSAVRPLTPPHTYIRPATRIESTTSMGQLSEGTMMWRSGQHLSYHSSPPGKTFSRLPTRVLEMRSYTQLLACGGVGLVPSGSSGTDRTEWSFGNLNGVGVDPTERGGSRT